MSRHHWYILPLVAIAVWAILAVVLGSASLDLTGSGGTPSAKVSPACLPSTLDRTAKLAGTSVEVSPAPETDTANPHTQISFLGVPASEIHDVSVAGLRSGAHAGALRAYSQADGASFQPYAPFAPGERVTVRALIGPGALHANAAGDREVAFRFRTDTPYPTANTTDFANLPPAPADSQSFYTLPSMRAPILTVTAPDRDPAAGEILTTNGPGPGQYGPLIYSPQGRLVWFDQLPNGEAAEDLAVQTYEGQPALTWWRGHVLSLGFGQGEDVVMSSHYQTVARVAGGNGLGADLHDFQLAPDHVAYITAFNPIRCDLAPVKGARDGAILDTAIQEIDMRTGLVRWEWHALDHVAAADSEVEASTDSSPWDWFHLNSIDAQPGGSLLISARSTWAAYQLQAGTGKILWRLGGDNSSFAMGPGTETAWQHDARILPNGEITLFDDGSNPPIHSQSRAVRIALDSKTHRARLTADYTHSDPPLLASSQGNMQTLPDGNTVVGYGGLPAISEYAPDGSLLLDAHLPYDMTFYRAFRSPWSARPASPPAVRANLNDTGEETIVHMSWNGATEVASWRVLAGVRAAALSTQATIASGGFESSTILPKKHAYVAVQALDAAGHAIGASPAVAVTSFASSLPNSGRPR